LFSIPNPSRIALSTISAISNLLRYLLSPSSGYLDFRWNSTYSPSLEKRGQGRFYKS